MRVREHSKDKFTLVPRSSLFATERGRAHAADPASSGNTHKRKCSGPRSEPEPEIPDEETCIAVHALRCSGTILVFSWQCYTVTAHASHSWVVWAVYFSG